MENLKSVSTNLDDDSKDGTASSVTANSEEDPGLQPYFTFQEKLKKLLHSHKFQVGVITLVIVDCLLVVSELLIDMRLLEHKDHTEQHKEEDSEKDKIYLEAAHILHHMSIAILCVFIIEIIAKIYAFRIEFFNHKLEVFDAFVIFLSFALDVAFRNEESVANALGLVILLRLWRVARILNGIVLSVKTQTEHKLLKERRLKEGLEQELLKCKDYSDALELEVNLLRQLLQQHGIQEVPPSVIETKIPKNSTIKVVAEMNHSQPSPIA